ncbi:hypothetical protein J1G44_16695 [Cellulomonas sp. zg-ZUI199]|uniref:Uncharacterized protein n=1 Tax=Cellulomonas wangleii TaxID=2816956 RepID=A0ABX8D821_9CELL|nr:hypothetical protein [Cellulomonas wangleii]MBO0926117.1 hypothetical protein [Cellulomonas wangleii]QVI62636.1 hypothetical protein KG103_01410 [Cellulomonas wangleii]
MTSPSLRDQKLVELYQNTLGAVAFLDESYRARPVDGQPPFYSMSAVTFATDQLDHVREVLTDIAGGLSAAARSCRSRSIVPGPSPPRRAGSGRPSRHGDGARPGAAAGCDTTPPSPSRG